MAMEATILTRLRTGTVSHNEIISSYGLYSMDITPLDELGRNLSKSKNFSNRTFARLNFKFTDWLRYTASFQYEVGNIRQANCKIRKAMLYVIK